VDFPRIDSIYFRMIFIVKSILQINSLKIQQIDFLDFFFLLILSLTVEVVPTMKITDLSHHSM